MSSTTQADENNNNEVDIVPLSSPTSTNTTTEEPIFVTSLNNAKYRNLPQKVWKELQRLASVVCYDIACREQPSLTVRQQYLVMEELYFGSANSNKLRNKKDIVGQVKILCQGAEKYTDLFVRTTVMNASSTSTISELRLVDTLHRFKGFSYVVGEDFNYLTLCRRSKYNVDQRITGKTLYELAKDALKNGKKAILFGLEHIKKKKEQLKKTSPSLASYVDELKEYELPLGLTSEDLLMHIMACMYASSQNSSNSSLGLLDDNEDQHQHQASEEKSCEREEQDYPSADTNNVPENYVFPGYFAFILLGPFQFIDNLSENNQVNFMNVDKSEKQINKKSRDDFRKTIVKEEKAVENFDTNLEYDDDPATPQHNQKLTLESQMIQRYIIEKEKDRLQREEESYLQAIQHQLTHYDQRVDKAFERAQIFARGKHEDNDNKFWRELYRLQLKRDEVETELEESLQKKKLKLSLDNTMPRKQSFNDLEEENLLERFKRAGKETFTEI